MAGERSWTTPSDLAEYAFCPRAHFYRQLGPEPRSPPAEAGTSYHRRSLSSERWRDEHPWIPWLAIVAGVGVLTLAALVLVP